MAPLHDQQRAPGDVGQRGQRLGGSDGRGDRDGVDDVYCQFTFLQDPGLPPATLLLVLQSGNLFHFEFDLTRCNGLCQESSFTKILDNLVDLSGSFWCQISLITDIAYKGGYILDY